MIWIKYASIAAAAVATLGAVTPQQPVFRGTAEAVKVFVTVTDRDGRLVTTLSQNDFEVRDDGKSQPITIFDNTPQPVRLIEMLDVSGSMEGNLPLLRAASDQLFERLRQDDLVRVGSFGQQISIAPRFTHDLAEMRRSLPDYIPPDAPTPLWRACDEAMTAFRGEGESDARPVILVMTDGKDNAPFSFKQPVISQAEVIDRARRENVMVYAVGMRSRMRRSAPPGLGRGGLQAMLSADLPDPGLAVVAEQTGGGYAEIRYGEDLGAAFARVADELHSQYLIGYAPPKRDGRKHTIEVRVAERGMKPRARKDYLAPK